MSVSIREYDITWDSHRKTICQGLSDLLKGAEFVDLTLVAEGYITKVHKNIIALASPYLKAVIQSVPCQNPVIFLNNTSSEDLEYILEYIYMGEVHISTWKLESFIKTAKALHIAGVEDLIPSFLQKENVVEEKTVHNEVTSDDHIIQSQNKAQVQASLNENYAANIIINDQNTLEVHNINNDLSENDFEDPCSNVQNITSYKPVETELRPSISTSELKFTFNSKDSMQIIFDGYLYNSHHKTTTNKHRWRCIHYRHGNCKSFIDTENGIITNKFINHNHDDHSLKIISKMGFGKVFDKLSDAMDYKKILSDQRVYSRHLEDELSSKNVQMDV